MGIAVLICMTPVAATAQLQPVGNPQSGSNAGSSPAAAADSPPPTLDELKAAGAQRSSYRQRKRLPVSTAAPQPRLAAFRKQVEPVLKKVCVRCHGPRKQEGNIRIDTLNPDLLRGTDVDWWIEILAVLSNGEMPPPESGRLADTDRSRLVEWISSEIQVASTVRRAEQGHSSFRRMTRYEYNYALQDLLELPYDFAKDLPPEASSDDGFQNSSELLHMSSIQFGIYRELSRQALQRATVQGPRPTPIYWAVSMQAAAAKLWSQQDAELEKIRQQHKDDPEKREREIKRRMAKFRARPNSTHYKNLTTERAARAAWSYGGAKYAWKPTETRSNPPAASQIVAVIPTQQKLIVELGNRVPDRGTLRVRVRAARTSVEARGQPSLRLEFGWQASNDSAAAVKISDQDLAIDAPPDAPRFYQWDVPLSEIYPRNWVRKTAQMGQTPSPSEFVKLVNSSVSPSDIQIDYVEVTAPIYETWPPDSHRRIFIEGAHRADEAVYAQQVLTRFMSRAWRRPATSGEIARKVALFNNIRPGCDRFEDAMIEVLATVLSAPQFLYLVRSDQPRQSRKNAGLVRLSDAELASRLSIFLWCSTPDSQLRDLAAQGRLGQPDVLTAQVKRLLADARSRRFSRHFVRQWLGLQLLDYLKVDKKTHRAFDADLKDAMQREPVALFHEVLQKNHSVLDFIHADYTLANERLAKHYGLSDVYGNHFRRVQLQPTHRRGGLLTQAGLLAMNSDGADSHPLKRGIWMLERLLNDPPPPPPPAVPEIDLADPEIAKLTLKQRIQNHRNQAACMSCHAKIDPWGIAFENFDAVGLWRTQIEGKPVDASSLLFNGQKLDGMDGLKRFLLNYRQDQFARALVHKMTTYAVGRPLTFGDRSSVDSITADLRRQGDGLATLVTLIVKSDVFQSK